MTPPPRHPTPDTRSDGRHPTPDTRHPRFERDATVVSHERIVGHEFEIVFLSPEIAQAARPGQFVELLFGENYAPLVRRPFSLYRVDKEAGTFSVLYLARGSFTSGLAQKMVGDRVSLLGPLGNPFAWSEEPEHHHILIAGGIGAPPLYFLAREICRTHTEAGISPGRVVVINGARNQEMLVGMGEFGALPIQLIAITEDGSSGERGLTTERLLALLETQTEGSTSLYACGPMPMLRAIGEIATARSLPCQLSLETSMPCGTGICYGCAIPVRDVTSASGFRYARACWEGPVFEASELLWT